MSDLVAPCPLCGATFDDDGAYTAHLADEHGLVDDEGTETTLEHALVVSGIAGDLALADEAAAAAAASKAEVAGAAEPTLHPSRIYDPTQDDHRYRPLAIGLAGVLLLAFVGIGAVLTSGGSSGGPREVAVADTAAIEPAADKNGVGAPAPVDPTAAPAAGATDPAAVDPAAPLAADGSGDPGTSGAEAAPLPADPPPPALPAADPPPTTEPPPPPPPPAPTFVAPTLGAARIDGCQRSGRDGTWTFSYALSGGSAWAPAAGASAVGGGRYREQRTGKAGDGFPSSSIQVVDTTTGQARSIALSPSLVGEPCR